MILAKRALRVAAAMILPAALAGCSGMLGGEDFDLVVERPMSQVMPGFSALGSSSSPFRAIGISFPRARMTRPTPEQLLFHMPVESDADGSNILMTFTPTRNGQATRIGVTVDVPDMEFKVGGETRSVSEWRVERMLKEDMESLGSAIDAGRSGQSAARDIIMLLDGLVIIGDPGLAAAFTRLATGRSSLAAMLGDSGGGSYSRSGNTEAASAPMTDTDDNTWRGSSPTSYDEPYEGEYGSSE